MSETSHGDHVVHMTEALLRQRYLTILLVLSDLCCRLCLGNILLTLKKFSPNLPWMYSTSEVLTESSLFFPNFKNIISYDRACISLQSNILRKKFLFQIDSCN